MDNSFDIRWAEDIMNDSYDDPLYVPNENEIEDDDDSDKSETLSPIISRKVKIPYSFCKNKIKSERNSALVLKKIICVAEILIKPSQSRTFNKLLMAFQWKGSCHN